LPSAGVVIQAGFKEGARVEQAVDALAGVKHALRLAFGELLLAAHCQGARFARFQLLQLFFKRHDSVPCTNPDRARGDARCCCGPTA
jgi:hypothetical protein